MLDLRAFSVLTSGATIVFRPCREHCLVLFMTEPPHLNRFSIGRLQPLASISKPMSMLLSPKQSRSIPDLVALQFQQLIVQSIANHVDPVASLGNKVTGHHGELKWEECRVVYEQLHCALGLRGG